MCEPGLSPGGTVSGPAGRWGAGLGAASLEVVLALTVPSQVHFALEALGAQLTAERFEACVLPAVGDEVGALAECLATHLALVGLLAYRDGRERGKHESMIKLAGTHSDPQDLGSSWLHHSLRPVSSLEGDVCGNARPGKP